MLGTKKEVKGNSEVSRLEKKYINKIGAGALERNSVLYLCNLQEWVSFGGKLIKQRVSLATIIIILRDKMCSKGRNVRLLMSMIDLQSYTV